MISHQAQLSAEDLAAAVSRSLGFLRRNFRELPESGERGWYHYLDDDRPGVTASAVGLFCFGVVGQQFERTDEVVDYLVASQVTAEQARSVREHDADRLVGGWPVRTTRGFPILEATAWVVRALSQRTSRPHRCVGALSAGVGWLQANQNTDFGWGSHHGESSRVFHTALALQALLESGAERAHIENGARWLIGAQDPSVSAWGPLPGLPPTLLHSAYALAALSQIPNMLSEQSMRACLEWIVSRLEPGQHTELTSENEEFTVRIQHGDAVDEFHNSLPHFAGPICLEVALRLDPDPFRRQFLSCVKAMLASQSPDGIWQLPRNPARPSIWAMWPFLAALARAGEVYTPAPKSNLYLLFDGVALQQTNDPPVSLSVALILRRTFRRWMLAHRRRLGLFVAALVCLVVPLLLSVANQISVGELIVLLVVSPALLLFELLFEWHDRRGGRE